MAETDPVRKDDPEPTTDPEPKAKAPQGADDDTDWKAEARKWESRAKQSRDEAKANADAARKLKELEDADKSEVEKASAAAEAASKRAEEAEARALRLEIAHEKGLTPSQAKRLVGATREELEADADELVEAFAASNGKGGGKKTPADAPSTSRGSRPTENLRPGASADDDEPELSGKEVADLISKEDRL